MSDLGYAPLFGILLLQFGFGVPIGLLALQLLDVADEREQFFAGLAAGGLGFFTFGGITGIATVLTGRVTIWLYTAIWFGLVITLALVWWRFRRVTRLELAGTFAGVLLAVPLGWLIYGPVYDFPVAPDYDGTADGYLAAIVKLGGQFPRFHPFGDADFIEVNVPPSVACMGAYLSMVTGMLVSRVQIAHAGGAWIFYILAVPFVAYQAFRDTRFPVGGALLSAVLSYTLSMKWTYYDGSYLRVYGMLGLLLSTGLYLRALSGSRPAALGAGLFLGLTLYYHQRYFMYGALFMGLFSIARFVPLLLRGERDAVRQWFLQIILILLPALTLTAIFLKDKLFNLFATSQHPSWTQPLFTFRQAFAHALRFQGEIAFFAGILGAIVVLLYARTKVIWNYLACALLLQVALSFEFAHYLLPVLRPYVEASTINISGFSDVRPQLTAALLLAPAGLFSTHPPAAFRRNVGLSVALVLAAVMLVVAIRAPISARFTHLTPGDAAALSWLREHTRANDTLVLNFPWNDLPDEILSAHYGFQNHRGFIPIETNLATFWVTPVAERRSVFHWMNRLLHEGKWNVVRLSSPGLLARLEALSFASLNPCAPGAEEAIRRNGVTHVFVTPLLHTLLKEKIDGCHYLHLVYLASPPFRGYYGHDDLGYKPPNPSLASAIYEVVPR